MKLRTNTDLFSLALLLLCIRRLLCYKHGRSEFLEYFLLEEQPQRTFVGDLASDARLVEKHGTEILRQLRFHFVSSASVAHRKHFEVSTETGVLWTVDTVDRETVCDSGVTACTLCLNVYVTPTAFFEIIKVQIHVIDVNDNNPRFPVSVFSISVPEESQPGTLFPLPAATDLDHGPNSVQGYFLSEQGSLGSGTNQKFGLRAVMRARYHLEIYLEVLLPLDRESNPCHSLILVASDAGYPVRTGSVTLNITVLDYNDNEPRFTQEVYEFSVSENQARGTTIGKVSANDLDEGVNSKILYALVESGSTSNGHPPLLVDPVLGWITVVGELDFESQEDLRITITAVDQGHRQRTGFSQILVRILDENDNAPQIALHLIGGGEGRPPEVAENQGPGSFVVHVSVSDRDSGHNGEFRCGVRGLRGHFNLIQLNSPTEFKLVTTSTLDREVNDSYNVTVICSDNGPQPLSTSMTFPVCVTDENDNDPRFEQDVYSVEICENNEIGTFLIRIAASDADAGNNSAIFYDVIKTDDVRDDVGVAIDAATGDISSAMIFDREVRASYDYTLVAYDRGVPQRSSTASLTILIRDLNDEIPKFTQRRYRFEIVENEPKETEIGKVTALDLDLLPFNEVTYVIDRTYEDGLKFRVNETSGSVHARFSFDREERDFYQFAVFAQDGALPSHKGVAMVIIYVIDVNDNAPIFLFPCLANNTIQMVGTDVVPRTVAGTISAFDPDVGQNGRLRFSLVSGNGSEVFEVDGDTGQILVKSTYTPNSLEDTRTYQLNLEVSDSGQPSLNSTACLFVSISHSFRGPNGSGNESMSVVIGLAGFFGVSFALVCFWLILVKILLDRQETHSASFASNSEVYAII